MKTLVKWSVSEYHKLIEKGFLDRKKVELLNGELVEMALKSPQHSYTAEGGRIYLAHLLGNKAVVREAHPITLSNSEPEPDIAVVKSPRENYGNRHPFITDVFWLIEVANSTLTYDLNEKKETYAKEGIKEYWVLNLKEKQLHVFKDLVDGQYFSENIQSDGTIFSEAFPDLEISVSQLLN